jgi:hypothetical protein
VYQWLICVPRDFGVVVKSMRLFALLCFSIVVDASANAAEWRFQQAALRNNAAPVITNTSHLEDKNYLPKPVILTGGGVEPNSLSLVVTIIDQYGQESSPPTYANLNGDGTWVTPAILGVDALAEGPVSIKLVETDWVGNVGDPIIVSDIEKDYVYNLDYNENDTQAVIDIDTTDDIDTEGGAEGNALSYQLSGDDAEHLRIDANGVIHFKQVPDFESPLDVDADNQYHITVQVSDSEGLTDTLPMVIQVIDKESMLLTVKALLQGAWLGDETVLMRDDLRIKQLLPLQEPYSNLGYVVGGHQQMNADLLAITGDDAIVDWVLLEFRQGTEASSLQTRIVALLQRDGDIVDAQTGQSALNIDQLSAGSYYLVLRHRNHLGVMTQQAINLLSDGELVHVDFSSPSLPVWGNNARWINNDNAFLWAGDANHDGRIINIGIDNDINPLMAAVLGAPDNTDANLNYVYPQYHLADLNLDGNPIKSGANNDENILKVTLFLFPDNATHSLNYVIRGQVP